LARRLRHYRQIDRTGRTRSPSATGRRVRQACRASRAHRIRHRPGTGHLASKPSVREVDPPNERDACSWRTGAAVTRVRRRQATGAVDKTEAMLGAAAKRANWTRIQDTSMRNRLGVQTDTFRAPDHLTGEPIQGLRHPYSYIVAQPTRLYKTELGLLSLSLGTLFHTHAHRLQAPRCKHQHSNSRNTKRITQTGHRAVA
jgi:hypothetical protein